MSTDGQLKAYASDLAASLTRYCRNEDASSRNATSKSSKHGSKRPSAPSHSNAEESSEARKAMLAALTKLQSHVFEPTDFIQELARQNQLLACLQWLGEFQVLACIPLTGSAAFKDVAQVVDVPEEQLCRVVRMTATAGFLQEPCTGYVAHTSLSAPFVTKPSFLDGAMFLAELAAPSALHMADATQRFGLSQRPDQTAYNAALDTTASFSSACEQRSKLQRQWPAFLRYGTADCDAACINLLASLDCLSLGTATVVDVGANSASTAIALAEMFPALHLIVQLNEPSPPSGQLKRKSTSGTVSPKNKKDHEIPPHLTSRISIQSRTSGSLQTVERAEVYILHLPSPSPTSPTSILSARIITELRAHLGVLRASPGASLVLAVRLLPEPGSVDVNVEANARVRDLCLQQLANEKDFEAKEMMSMLASATDNSGRLVLVDQKQSRSTAMVAFEVRYQAYSEH